MISWNVKCKITVVIKKRIKNAPGEFLKLRLHPAKKREYSSSPIPSPIGFSDLRSCHRPVPRKGICGRQTIVPMVVNMFYIWE